MANIFKSVSNQDLPKNGQEFVKMPLAALPGTRKAQVRQMVAWSKNNGRQFAIDTAINFIYWMPVLGVSERTFMGYTTPETFKARFGNMVFSLLTGGIYMKALDLGRFLFNRQYYENVAHGAPRKENTLSKFRDAAVDILSTSVYWNTIMGVWLHYANNFSLERIADAVFDYTIVYAAASPIFGKFANFLRNKAH